MNISPRPTPERPTTPTRRTNPSSSSSSPGYGHYLDLDKTPTSSPGYKTYKAKLTGKSEKEILEIQKKLFQFYRSNNPKSDTLVEPTNVANPDESITNSPGYRTSKVRGYLTAQLEKF